MDPADPAPVAGPAADHVAIGALQAADGRYDDRDRRTGATGRIAGRRDRSVAPTAPSGPGATFEVVTHADPG